MAAKLILGKEISGQIYAELAKRIEALRSRGTVPGLAVLIVGGDPASHVYVHMKEKKCREIGIRSLTRDFPADVSQDDLIAEIARLNADDGISGILVQLPLPDHIDVSAVMSAIDPGKDVDCFNPVNVGRLMFGNPLFQPATPAGILQMLKRSGIGASGKNVVIVGRSNIVGKPLAAMLIQRGVDATVTVANTKTRDLGEHTRIADILIVAAGSPRMIKADMVKDGAVVIDVGTSRVPDPTAKNGSRMVGDVDFDAVKEKASYITPVPGGVGPMTICMLMLNTVSAAERRARD